MQVIVFERIIWFGMTLDCLLCRKRLMYGY